MCNQDDSSHWWLLFLFALLVLFSVRTVSGQEMDTEEPKPSTSQSSLTPTSEPQSPTDWQAQLLTLWTQYDQEFQTSMGSLDEFLSQVEAYGISFEDLPKYIEFLESSFKASEDSKKAQALVAATEIAGLKANLSKAETSRDMWRTGALVSGGLALLFGGIVAVGIIF